jgi:hypothetical protein
VLKLKYSTQKDKFNNLRMRVRKKLISYSNSAKDKWGNTSSNTQQNFRRKEQKLKNVNTS